MNKRHYEHTLPNIRGSLSNTYKSVLEQYLIGSIIFAMACSLLSGVISTVLLAICRRKNGYD